MRARPVPFDMIYLGVSRKVGVCGICKKNFTRGTHVYHNTEKSQGSHLAHKSCWDTLAASRPRKFTGKKTEILSVEKLDPPF